MAQSVEQLTLGFDSSHDLRVMRPSPKSGSLLNRGLLEVLSLSAPPLVCV